VRPDIPRDGDRLVAGLAVEQEEAADISFASAKGPSTSVFFPSRTRETHSGCI